MAWYYDEQGQPMWIPEEGEGSPKLDEQGRPITPWGAVGRFGSGTDGPWGVGPVMGETPSAPLMTQREDLSPEEGIRRMLDVLLQQQFPLRQQALFGAIPRLQAVANASPRALQQQAGPQMQQLARMLQQIQTGLSRQLGPFGGGQTQRGTQEAITQIGEQATQLLTSQPGQARQRLQELSGASLLLPSRERTGTQSGPGQPFDAAGFARAMGGLFGTGGFVPQLWNLIFPPNPFGGFTGGVSPPTVPTGGFGMFGNLPTQ